MIELVYKLWPKMLLMVSLRVRPRLDEPEKWVVNSNKTDSFPSGKGWKVRDSWNASLTNPEITLGMKQLNMSKLAIIL